MRSPGRPSADADLSRIGGRTFDDFLDEAEAFEEKPALAQDPDERERKSGRNFIGLSALFRRNDDAVEEALEAIENGSSAAPRIWDALSAAGTPASQEALRSLIAMPQWTLSERRNQMVGLSFVKQPTQETVDFLVSRFGDLEQGDQARLGVGTAVHNLLESDPKRADAAFQVLTRTLDQSVERNETSALLRALGNSGHSNSLAAATPFFQSPDMLVRASAAQAVRFSPQPEASNALAELIAIDPEPYVRGAAVNALADRGVSDWSIALLSQTARKDASATVRRESLVVLSKFADDRPELTQLVEQIVAEGNPG